MAWGAVVVAIEPAVAVPVDALGELSSTVRVNCEGGSITRRHTR
jgi:hypothetical protein